jgi:effector-binding domain-containing protein
MSDPFNIVEIEPVVLALTESRLKSREVSARIRGMFDIVYKWLPQSGVRQVGHNYAVYDEFGSDGMRVRVGFPVSGRFSDSLSVKCVQLEAGRAAHTKHTGPYGELHVAYRNLTAWCTRNSLQTGGQSWEVYGDWHDDPARLVTDLFFRLKREGDA